MTRRARSLVLGGLAVALGTLAATDVHRREAAVDGRLAPLVDVVVAAHDLHDGRRLQEQDLAVRRIPQRFAPVGSATEPIELLGRRLAVAVPSGAFLAAGQIAADTQPLVAPLRRGERAAVVSAVGTAAVGARVDVVVTTQGEQNGTGGSRLVLQDVEVLAVGAAAEAAAPSGADARQGGQGRTQTTLRVTARQAVFLAAAGSFAREIRLLVRPEGDRAALGEVTVEEALR